MLFAGHALRETLTIKAMSKNLLLKGFTWLTYAAVALVPIIFFRYSMFPFGIPKIFLFQILAELMAAFWIGLVLLDKRYLPRRSPIFWSVAAFAAVLLLSGILGADHIRSFWSTIDRTIGIVGILHFMLFAVMLVGLGRELPWKKIWMVSFAVSSVVAISVFLSKWGLFEFFLNQNTARPGGLYGNALFVGQYLLFHAFVGAWLWRDARGALSRWFLGMGIALGLIAILITQTIGIILATAFGIAVLGAYFALRHPGNARRIAAGVLIAGAALSFGMLLSRQATFWQKVPGVSRIVSISLGQSDVRDRLLAWQTAWSGFKEKPLLGWGWENAYIPFNKHYDPKLLVTTIQGTFFDKPHNVYMEHLVTGGMLGLLSYLGLFAAMFWALRKSLKEGKSFAPFFGAALAAYLLQNAIAFDTIATYPMIALFIGFIASEAYPQSAAEENRSVPAWRIYAAPALLLLVLLPVWFLNVATMRMANKYYWGINYFLNGLMELSDFSWHKALQPKTPYIDYVRKDYASVMQQGFQQSLDIPGLDDKQKEAALLLEEVVANHPDDYFFRVATADYYITLAPFSKTEYLERAKEHLARAKELSPNRQQTYYVLARLQLSEGKKEEALQSFREAIALNPDAGETHFSYGMLLYGLGNPAEGRKEIARAAELGRNAGNIDEAVRLASFKADMDHDYLGAITNLKLALTFLGNVIEGSGRELDIRFKLGVAYYLAGDSAHAKEELQFVADRTDLTRAGNWTSLKPALDELGVKYQK